MKCSIGEPGPAVTLNLRPGIQTPTTAGHSSVLPYLYLQFFGHEGVLVHRGLDALAQRHARSMPSPGLHPDQDRVRPPLCSLQGSRVLEAVGRVDPVVVVARRDQSRRVAHTRPYVMERRVLIDRIKLGSIFRRRAILLLPRPADRE